MSVASGKEGSRRSSNRKGRSRRSCISTTMKQEEQDQERKVEEGRERRGVARRWIDYVGLWNSQQRVDYEV